MCRHAGSCRMPVYCCLRYAVYRGFRKGIGFMISGSPTGRLIEPLTHREWPAAELEEQVESRVAFYQSRGLCRGDRVILHFGNSLEFFAELLAIWRHGGCAIPVDGRLTPFEVGNLVAVARPRFRVVDDSTPAEVVSVPGTDVVHTLEHADQSGSGHGQGLRLDDPALILFTSGSTGEPKGVVHTHRSLRARWMSLRQELGLSAYRRSLCLLPTHFGHGLICNCLFPWLSGCDLFIVPPFRTDLLAKLGSLIDDHRISFLSSVPSAWTVALKLSGSPAGSSLQRVHVGSAPLSAALWRDIQNWCGIDDVFNAYGITETGSWVAGTSDADPVVPEDGLIGRPWGASVRVLQARDTQSNPFAGPDCEAGEPGMIWLDTPALMHGYYQREDLTDAVVFDGWFMTGDIGFLDERGRLYIKGRERDEINKGGLKIFPADIDAVVLELAGVADVCCFGYEDELYGENVGLAVVLESPDAGAMRTLQDWICSHIAEYRRPARWYLLDEIPRTSRGKVNRQKVMQACLSRSPVDPASL